MDKLAPLTALGSPSAHSDKIGTIRIDENAQLALASCAGRRGQEAQAIAALQSYIGTDLPEAGRSIQADLFGAIWMATDQWLISAPYDSHEDLADQIKEQLKATASVTEQSDAWVVFDVAGAQAVDLFERLCAAPVRRMKTGDATRSTLHHLGCFVICQETHNAFRVIGPRSSAGSLHHALVTAAQSIA